MEHLLCFTVPCACPHCQTESRFSMRPDCYYPNPFGGNYSLLERTLSSIAARDAFIVVTRKRNEIGLLVFMRTAAFVADTTEHDPAGLYIPHRRSIFKYAISAKTGKRRAFCLRRTTYGPQGNLLEAQGILHTTPYVN